MENREVSDNQDFFVVGIGASAGGLRALEEFFSSMSVDSGAAFVVIQHLSPDFKSLMKELLQRHTSMEVYQVKEKMELQANSVYLIPPEKNLVIKESKLSLEQRASREGEINFPIDIFFESLARNYGDRSIGIILSGSGSDGTRGLSAINEAGGIALVQDPSTAEFDGMPTSAISTGLVNQILPPKELAQLVYQCILSSDDLQDLSINQANFLDTSKISEITKIIKEVEELDFSHYKVSTLSRRIHRRRMINNLETVEDYIKLLRNSKEEQKILCSDLLINVTHFFRDRKAWEVLETNVIPNLLENTAPNEELRFWVTACSTGEEAYSLAILIDEALEYLDKNIKTKIFATDIDRTALEKASQGIYTQAAVKSIPQERLQKYFTVRENQFQVIRRLREMLIFAPQDLAQDAGFTRMNFISCRNVLIYLQSNLQYHVLRNLHFSLINQGILFLGEAENLGQLEGEFKEINRKWNIYQKRRDVRLPLLIRNPKRTVSTQLNYVTNLDSQLKVESILEQTINLLIKESNEVVFLANGDRQLIQVCGDGSAILQTPKGKITNDITKMVVAGLQLPLNTALYRAKKEKKPVLYTQIKLAKAINTYSLKVIYNFASSQSNEFYLIKIKEELDNVKNSDRGQNFEINTDAGNQILSLEYELQQTRENLHSLIEELETTNEEQQSSNEELIASNEELQSTNEELHSVNEELHTVNIEFQTKIRELIELNYDVENLLKSTDIGVIFLDSELKIRKFTPAIQDVIAIRDTDINRPLQEISYKFDRPDFITLLQEVIQNERAEIVEIQLKDAEKHFLMRLNPYYVEEHKCQGIVVSFVSIDNLKKVQQELQETLNALTQSETRLNLALSVGGIGIWIWEYTKDVLVWDDRLMKMHPIQPKQKPNTLNCWLNLIVSEDRQQVKQQILEATRNQEPFAIEYKVIDREEKVRYFSTKGQVRVQDWQPYFQLIGVTIDITEIREAERKLWVLNRELEERVAQRTQTLALFSDRLKQLHRLATTEHQDLATILRDYLKTGCQMFGFSTGIVSEVKDNLYKIVAVESSLDINAGYEVTCQDTYCKEFVEAQKTVALTHVETIESMREHPVYVNLKLESFIGTPIFVNGNIFGTLDFSHTQAKEKEFSQEEIEIIELMARDIGQFIGSTRAEKALTASEIRFRNTFEQAAVGIAHVSPKGRFIKVNQKLCDLLGYNSDRLLSLTFQDITHPEDLDIDLQYVKQVLRGEIDNYTLEKRYFNSDGLTIWANLTVSLVRNDAGKPEYFISVIEDVSKRKEIAQALNEAIQAKDTFISQMNHELRTPLNSILGFTQILQKDLTVNEQQKQTLDLIANSGEHLLTLINSILEFSKIEADRSILQEKDFNLSQFLDGVASTIRHRAETKGLAFNYHLDVSVPIVVRGDETKLKQLLLNLLDNAVKFTDRGSVTFNVTSLGESTSDYKAQIRFQVIDTGIGISDKDMELIFQPFTHIEKNNVYREGTGLGLTIAKKIARLMDSQLQFQSEENRGTTCWFDLDLSIGNIDSVTQGIAPEASGLSQESKDFSSNQKKILVVDDIKENRDLLTQFLTSLNFSSTEASNGKECLAIAESFQPDAILLDILMPEMDGIDTLKHLRQHPQLKDTIVIFISANARFESQLKAAKMKFEGFLAKPVDLDKLANLLQQSLFNSPAEITQKPVDTKIAFPKKELLEEILQLAEIGDMQTIIESSETELQDLGSNYHAFFTQILDLARQFQQYKLINYLKQFH